MWEVNDCETLVKQARASEFWCTNAAGGRVGRSWEQWRSLLQTERLPAAIVDEEALERNVQRTAALVPHGKTLRVASKSIRHVGALRRILREPRFQGVMCYSPYEAEFLAGQGFDDLLVAYPVADADSGRTIARLAARGLRVRQVVDSDSQLACLTGHETPISICLDVDASLRIAGLHLGVRRSPVRSVEDAVALARKARENGLVVDAVMAYEAQVAGLPDRAGFGKSAAVSWIKARSMPRVMALRQRVVEALKADGHPVSLVNGGGTGSLVRSAADGSLTELTAGSGFFCSHLFDGYEGVSLEPAAYFALRVVRSSDPGMVTAFGGGIIASGSTGPDRSPVVVEPRGVKPLGMEGWGEVQTPFETGGTAIGVGDPVICRPAKAGEWLERFSEVLWVKGDQVVGREPTYRGEGQCF